MRSLKTHFFTLLPKKLIFIRTHGFMVGVLGEEDLATARSSILAQGCCCSFLIRSTTI